MLLFRDKGVLYAECKMDLKFPIELNGKLYERNDEVSYEEIDNVYNLLKLNARVLVNIDGKFVKPDLYWLGTALLEKNYEISEGLPMDVVGDVASEAAEFNPTPVVEEEVEEEVVEEDSEDDKDNRNENHGKNRKKRNNNNNNQEGDK